MKQYEHARKAKRFWKAMEEWDLEKILPQRGIRQKQFIKEYFIPLLKNTDTLGEIACGSGVATLQIAPFVQSIDAFDISARMIKTARDNAYQQGIDNVNFRVCPAERVRLTKQYSHCISLGLFTYIESDTVVRNIIQKLSRAMKNGGGYLLIKESVARDTRVYYETDDYIAFYRKEEEYLALYDGFTLLHKGYLREYTSPYNVGSIICILQKNV